MRNAKVNVPRAVNEKVLSYAPGSAERAVLKEKLKELISTRIEIPLIIGGQEIKTGNVEEIRIPHNYKHILGIYHKAGEKETKMAIEASLDAWSAWSKLSWEARASIFKRMASILQRPYEQTLNAATMLGQSKNVFQAEIDAACELIDFFNFNTSFGQEIYEQQPPYSPDGTWNMVEHRPLEGFIFAVTPFNFTSIAGNLPSVPALMGNVVVWKPASSAVYSAYYIMKLFQKAGIPDGVINFLPGPGSKIGSLVLENENLAGIHFTGSTAVFQNIWKTIGNNIKKYKSYPRIVGETGGKDFCLAHESANIDALVTAMIRGAFEYQGQKCSALSRAYIPSTIWDQVRKRYIEEVATIKMGTVEDFSNFMNAVIDRNAFESITGYIEYAKKDDKAEIITGGGYNDSIGFFIEPTTILTTDPHFKTMEEEIFGPVLTIFIYNPSDWRDTLELVDKTSPYGLTGCVFGSERKFVEEATKYLTHAAGNFYINDKPTGAVVGQQPFGGSRASGTNDKAGSMLNLLRWVSQRTIKETFDPPVDYRYPFMKEK